MNPLRKLAAALAALAVLLAARLALRRAPRLTQRPTPRLAPLVAAGLVALAGAAHASEAGYPLDSFPPDKLTEQASLQNGAKLFVNYCLNCHSANLMRYNRLQDLGLTEDQIRKNLLFTGEKVGDTMRVAMRPEDAKAWFGVQPPDLSVIARARGSEAGPGPSWLYTYLRAFYRDETRPTGWNNAVFENVGMPHVLWQLQGPRGATIEEVRATKDDKGRATGYTRTVVTYDSTGQRSESVTKLPEGEHPHEGRSITLGKPVGGELSAAQFDEAMADLAAYITYMSDPSQGTRVRIGVWVLLFLGFFTVLAWNLNRVYWKDVH